MRTKKKKKVTKRARLKKPIGGCLAVDLSNAIGTLNVNVHESVYEKKKKVIKRARLKKPIGGCLAVDLSNAIGTLNVNIHESVYEKKKSDQACSPEEANRWMPRRRPQQYNQNTQREHSRECVRKRKR